MRPKNSPFPDADYAILEVADDDIVQRDGLIVITPRARARFARIGGGRAFIDGEIAVAVLALFTIWGFATFLLGFFAGGGFR